MKTKTCWARTGASLLILGLSNCGGGGGSTTPTVVTPPPVPAVTIAAVGSGALVLHPSLDRRFALALETPIRLTESGGGTADWNFARISILRSGREIERYELGSDDIRTAGFNRVAANSNRVINVYFRQNSDDFDRVDITLGFADLKDGRQFTVLVPFGSFSGVNISLTPALSPRG